MAQFHSVPLVLPIFIVLSFFAFLLFSQGSYPSGSRRLPAASGVLDQSNSVSFGGFCGHLQSCGCGMLPCSAGHGDAYPVCDFRDRSLFFRENPTLTCERTVAVTLRPWSPLRIQVLQLGEKGLEEFSGFCSGVSLLSIDVLRPIWS